MHDVKLLELINSLKITGNTGKSHFKPSFSF